jgi:hypothetical protein
MLEAEAFDEEDEEGDELVELKSDGEDANAPLYADVVKDEEFEFIFDVFKAAEADKCGLFMLKL